VGWHVDVPIGDQLPLPEVKIDLIALTSQGSAECFEVGTAEENQERLVVDRLSIGRHVVFRRVHSDAARLQTAHLIH
jgi:hypothetical protein